MTNLIQFDVEPQQTILANLQTGIQIVATINIEDLIDGIALKGLSNMSSIIGNELIDLLKVKDSLIKSIDPQKHIDNVKIHIKNELDQKDYE